MRLQKKLELMKFTQDFPDEKLTNFRNREGNTAVMFVGRRYCNDAPALAVLIAVLPWEVGADAIEAADAVFMTSNVEAIPIATYRAKKLLVRSLGRMLYLVILATAALVMRSLTVGFANMWMYCVRR